MKKIKTFILSCKEIFYSSKIISIILLSLIIIRGIVPVFSIFVFAKLTQAIFYKNNFYYLLIIFVLLFIIPNLINSFIIIIQTKISEEVFYSMSRKLLIFTNKILKLNFFENKEIYNNIYIINQNIHNRPVNFIVTIFLILLQYVLFLYPLLCIV